MYFEFLLIPNSFAPRPHVVVAYFVDKIFATDFIAIDIERICRVKTWHTHVQLMWPNWSSAILLKILS